MVTVLESVATGIIAFNDALELLSINRAALQMLQLEAPPRCARLLSEISAGRSRVRSSVAVQELTSGRARAREVALILGGELHYLELSVARLGSGAGWVLALEDSTQLVQAQKLAAWNEAARRIAHEIKNPLTPIQLSAERIARKFRNGDADTGAGHRAGDEDHRRRGRRSSTGWSTSSPASRACPPSTCATRSSPRSCSRPPSSIAT